MGKNRPILCDILKPSRVFDIKDKKDYDKNGGMQYGTI